VMAGLRRSELDSFLDEATDACTLADGELRRTSALVQRFKQVAVDRASLERRDFDLAEVLLDADPRLRRGSLEDGIALELDLEPGIVMHSYPGPLEQVVANLLNNALLHAYPQPRRGRIRLSAHRDGQALVRIEVADDGRGIAPEHLSRIFEPFFTTARNRGGTGLGLGAAYRPPDRDRGAGRTDRGEQPPCRRPGRSAGGDLFHAGPAARSARAPAGQGVLAGSGPAGAGHVRRACPDRARGGGVRCASSWQAQGHACGNDGRRAVLARARFPRSVRRPGGPGRRRAVSQSMPSFLSL